VKEKEACLCDHASVTVVKKPGGTFMQVLWYVMILFLWSTTKRKNILCSVVWIRAATLSPISRMLSCVCFASTHW